MSHRNNPSCCHSISPRPAPPAGSLCGGSVPPRSFVFEGAMRGSIRLHLVLLLATAFAAPTLADTDATLSQVYEAERTGHLDQARQMMNQVLRDHPKSAKAHYVAAEVNAASGNFDLGRQELRLAQDLAPGLPFAAPESVRELEDKLLRTSMVHTSPARSQTAAGFPWSVLAVVVIGTGVVLVLAFMRRRAPSNSYTQPRELVSSPAAASPARAAAAAGLPPSADTGIGPNIAGGLAGGLAAGAGIVAGEEIARHLLDSGEHEVNSPPVSEIAQEHERDSLGGAEFGVSNASSWNDEDQASGGDDWT
jgi:hypothetical protein